VAGQLPREAHNAPLHLFSASASLVDFAQGAYRRRSRETSLPLDQLLTGFQAEGLAMSYTMEDFKRDYIKEHFPKLTPQEHRELLQSLPPEEHRELLQSLSPEERRDVLQSLPPKRLRKFLKSLPPEELLASLSAEQIRNYLDRQTAPRPPQSRKPRRKR
jgi:hypothetical protein